MVSSMPRGRPKKKETVLKELKAEAQKLESLIGEVGGNSHTDNLCIIAYLKLIAEQNA